MKREALLKSRRSFIKVATAATGIISFGGFDQLVEGGELLPENSLYTIGPVEGYSPQIGTLVSMLNYNRHTVLNLIRNLTTEQLDYTFDAKANSIGALVLHLGAVERFYQINTFENRQDFNADEKKQWGAAMELGDEGRKSIKGNDIKFYINSITEVREKTLKQLKDKDDKWLSKVDEKWTKRGALNTYWKWFHVCEHESHHRGQISWLKSRLPGAKEGAE